MADTAPALFYDGRSPRGRPVRLRIEGELLHAEPVEPEDNIDVDDATVAEGSAERDDGTLPRSWPLAGLRWPERQRHGPRLMDLPDGSSLQASDARAWDALAQQAGRRDSLVVRAQQSWRGTLLAVLLVVALIGGLQRWGVPALAGGITAMLPASVDRTLGERTLQALDAQMFKPSRIDAAERAALEAVMAEVLARHPDLRPSGADTPPARLLLRDTGRMANAWALPDGTIVLSDAMVRLIGEDTDAAGQRELLIGLFGHELGHVTQRHGLKMLVQVSLTSALGTLVFGDISGLLASAPLLLGQLAWSREAEREADVTALERLRAHGLDGEPMARLLERLAGGNERDASGSELLSSHPDHAERIAWFRQPG